MTACLFAMRIYELGEWTPEVAVVEGWKLTVDGETPTAQESDRRYLDEQ